jgi:hypothetical protein
MPPLPAMVSPLPLPALNPAPRPCGGRLRRRVDRLPLQRRGLRYRGHPLSLGRGGAAVVDDAAPALSRSLASDPKRVSDRAPAEPLTTSAMDSQPQLLLSVSDSSSRATYRTQLRHLVVEEPLTIPVVHSDNIRCHLCTNYGLLNKPGGSRRFSRPVAHPEAAIGIGPNGRVERPRGRARGGLRPSARSGPCGVLTGPQTPASRHPTHSGAQHPVGVRSWSGGADAGRKIPTTPGHQRPPAGA